MKKPPLSLYSVSKFPSLCKISEKNKRFHEKLVTGVQVDKRADKHEFKGPPLLEIEETITGWTVYTRVSIEPYMEDSDNNQFQANQSHDVADDTVAQIGAETEQIMTMMT